MRWLLVASLAIAVLTIVCLTLVLDVRSSREAVAIYQVADGTGLASVLLLIAIGFSGWGAMGSLLAMVTLLLLPVYAGLRVWARAVD